MNLQEGFILQFSCIQIKSAPLLGLPGIQEMGKIPRLMPDTQKVMDKLVTRIPNFY